MGNSLIIFFIWTQNAYIHDINFEQVKNYHVECSVNYQGVDTCNSKA